MFFYLAQGGTAVGTGINSRKTFDKKILVELKVIDHGTEFYTSNELSVLKQKIMDANREHGLQFENDFSYLNGIKEEKIMDLDY